MKVKRIFSYGLCFLLLSGGLLVANPDDEFQNRRRIRDNINTLRILKMTQALDLTEEQVAKIFPALNRIEKEKMEINKEIGQKVKELRLILEKENPEEQEIKDMIEELKRLRNLLESKDKEFASFLEENLTLVQQAKFILFSIDFIRVLREKIDRAKILQERLRRKDKR